MKPRRKAGTSKARASKAWWQGKLVLINGIVVDKLFVLTVVGASLALLAVLLGLLAYAWLDSRDEGMSELAAGHYAQTVVKDYSQSDLFSDTPLVDSLRLHLQATGYADHQSLVIDGTYHTRGLTFNLIAMSKRGGLVRQSLKNERWEIEAGWNGGTYWEENPISELKENATVTRHVNSVILRLQAAPAALGWQFIDGLDELSSGERSEIDGVLCEVIRNDQYLESPVYHYICIETGRELRRENVAIYDWIQIPITVDFFFESKGAAVEGLENLPSGYSVTVDETVIAKASFDKVRPNAGVANWMFDPLSELTSQ